MYTCYAKTLALKYSFIGLDVSQQEQNIFRSLFLKSYFLTIEDMHV